MSSDPGGWAGRGAPPPLDLLPPRVTLSPVPQTWPGYRISRSVCLCSWWRQASRGSLSLSSRLVRPLDDPLHPFAPKAVAIKREMVWAAMRERGPCLAVATNTSVQRISQGKQAVPVSRGGRSGTGERRAGDRRQSGRRASRTTLPRKRATSSRDWGAGAGAGDGDGGRPPPPRARSGAPRSLGSCSPDATNHPRGQRAGGLRREPRRGGQPRAGGQGTAACVSAALGGALRRGTPRPRCPLAVPRDRRLLQRRREAAGRARDASAAERKASAASAAAAAAAAAAGPRTLSSWMSRSVDLSMERN